VGGVAAFLVAQALMHLTDNKGWDDLAVWARAGAAVALCVIGVLATGLGALAMLGLITAVLVVELALELIDPGMHDQADTAGVP
jgi:hypothetical protein